MSLPSVSENVAAPSIPSARKRTWLVVAILLVWTAGVVLMSARHAITRDEMKALTIANSGGVHQIFVNLKYEAHPMLWYLMLRSGYEVYGHTVILKVLSIGVAFSAVALFLLHSPFPLWLRSLFIFGVPFYEYSVLARNYGISMLLLFLFGVFYTRPRRNPVLLGLTLFLLANTNAHSVILAGLLLLIWCWESIFRRAQEEPGAGSMRAAGIVLAGAGMLLSVVTVAQSGGRNQLIQRLPAGQAPHVVPAAAVNQPNPGSAFMAITGMDQISNAGKKRGLPPLVYEAGPEAISILVVLVAIAGLAAQPLFAAAALAGFLSLAVFFQFVAQGYFRHQALFPVFLLTLYWIALERTPNGQGRLAGRKGPDATFGLRAISVYALVPLLVTLFLVTMAKDVREIRQPASSSRDLAQLLKSRPELRGATLEAVPDFMLEPVPYYARNDIRFLCPGQSGKFVNWAPREKCRLDLGDIIAGAQSLHRETGRPVALLFANSFDETARDLETDYSVFSWNQADLARLHGETKLIASFHHAFTPDENYDVYVLK